MGINFRFYKLELKRLDWREYIHSDNLVAAALLSKMSFRPDERVRVKLEFLRMLAQMKLDPARMELLAAFFETYLKLNREEEEQLYQELGKLDNKFSCEEGFLNPMENSKKQVFEVKSFCCYRVRV